MATIVLRSPYGSNVNSTASTTVTFTAPTSPIANDVWICSASFGAGSAVTISGVPSGFHLIGRVDEAATSGVSTIVSYWYKCLGTESGSFATITLSASSKSVTCVTAFGNVAATPVVSGSYSSAFNATGTGPSVTAPTYTLGQAVYCYSGSKATTAASSLTVVPSPGSYWYLQGVSSGGSTATNVNSCSGGWLASTAAIGSVWHQSAVGTTACIQICVLDLDLLAGMGKPPQILRLSDAVNRAAVI